KFDGLIGDAVLRESGTAQAAYPAIPIQADPALANAAAVTTNGNGALLFDGAPGDYLAITGRVLGDVRYDTQTGPTFTRGVPHLAHLGCEVKPSEQPSLCRSRLLRWLRQLHRQREPVVDFHGVHLLGGDIPHRHRSQLGNHGYGRKGVFASAPAEKVGIFGIQDETGPTTLLGLGETLEGPLPTAPWSRASYYALF